MPTQSDATRAPSQRDIRRFAMQVLYQFDLRGEGDREAIREDICVDAESAPLGEAAFKLADAAWASHEICDALTTELAPDWPSHRQPPLDRALLRLAHHEITSGRTPAKVTINEIVELAKMFCAERSPSFINGVLDKMVKRINLPTVTEQPAAPATPTAESWLSDAVNDESNA